LAGKEIGEMEKKLVVLEKKILTSEHGDLKNEWK